MWDIGDVGCWDVGCQMWDVDLQNAENHIYIYWIYILGLLL